MEVGDEALERVVVEKVDQQDVLVGWVERQGLNVVEGRETGNGEDVVSKVGQKRLGVRW